jgi:transposase
MDIIAQKYVGIDIHKKFSQVAVMDAYGEVEQQRRVWHNDIEEIRSFFKGLGEDVSAAIEPTCGWMWLVDELESLGIDMHLAHPPAVALIAKSHVKTDKVDAKALAELLRLNALPEAYIAPPEVRNQRMLLRFREGIKKIRIMIKCQIHATLLRYNLIGPDVTDLFGEIGRKYINEVELPENARFIVDNQMALLEYLGLIMRRVEERINASIKEDRRAELLQSIPGIGKLTAYLLLAEIGDINRFRSSEAFVSYCGLCPSVHQSGEHLRYGRIYGGRRCLKWALVEAAQVAARYEPRLKLIYEAKRAQKGAGRATVTIAHKIADIIYRVLKEKTPYYSGQKDKKNIRTFKIKSNRKLSSAGPRSPMRASK